MQPGSSPGLSPGRDVAWRGVRDPRVRCSTSCPVLLVISGEHLEIFTPLTLHLPFTCGD